MASTLAEMGEGSDLGFRGAPPQGLNHIVLLIAVSTEYGTYETAKARFWSWLELFSVQEWSKRFKLFPHHSTEVPRSGHLYKFVHMAESEP